MSETPTPPDGPALLRALLEKRGYLYPHHRLMAAADPELFARYDRYYDALTLLPRALDEADREIVWAGLIVASRAGEGTHHFRRGERFGVDPASYTAAAAIAALAAGWDALFEASAAFVEWLPAEGAEAAYRAALQAVAGPLSARLVHLVAIAAHAGPSREAALRLHLHEAFAAGATMAEVAETLTYAAFHCGMPSLIHNAEIWQRAAADGLCPVPWPPEPT